MRLPEVLRRRPPRQRPKRVAVCIFAVALCACAAIQRKPVGFTDGAPWDVATWTDEAEPFDTGP